MGIPRSELETRRHTAIRSLADAGLDALILEPGTNFRYLTGMAVERSERLVALVLTAGGEAWIVGPAFEADRLGGAAPGGYIIWQEQEDPYSILAERLGGVRRVGLGPTTWFADAERLGSALSGASLRSAHGLLANLRMHKTPFELEAIRRAAAACRERIAAAHARLRHGIREIELAEGFGTGDDTVLVQFGPSGALPHGDAGERPLEPPTALLIDHWAPLEDGYWGDLTRSTWVGGDPPARYRTVWQTVLEAQLAGIDAARPGVPCSAVDAAARAVIERAGFGELFTHRLGHGLGLDVHEPPYLVEGNDLELEPGMVVTVEPGIYLPGEFGVRLEEDIVITETGAELLSKPQRNLDPIVLG
ncbi:MAG: aminopeptidase P family protein [Acidobacteria bacterium]|nr:aminopeptidase P family protein [Acidobacteriota bacterium]